MVEPHATPSGAERARIFGRRSRLVLVASTAYAAAAALRAAEGRGARAWGAACVALAVAWLAGARDAWTGLAAWGLALTIASFGAPEPGGWGGLFGLAGGCAAAVAAVVAIARVVAPQGLARPRLSPRALPWTPLAAVGVVGGLALVARTMAAWGSRALFAQQAAWLAPLACVALGGLLVAEAWRTAIGRRLELGVAARMHAAAGLCAAAMSVAWASWLVGFASAEANVRVGLAAASLLVCTVAWKGDPVDIARASRRTIALAVVGGPVVMLGAAAAEGRPWEAPAVVAVIGVIALAIGMAAPWIEEPLRPARGAWLDAVATAHEALLRTDPDEAVREALVALRAPVGLGRSALGGSPELWMFDPVRVTTVDAAGYAHVADGVLQAGLVAAATAEPEAVLRFEVLDALQVRMPELRPLTRWMEDHGAMLVAVVTRAGEAEGLLVLPRGRRAEALSLEEARAIKRLADALAALCHARAALARSLDRERHAALRAEGSDAALVRATEELERRASQHVLAAERLARPATVGIYSAAARFAFDAIEQAIRAERTLFVRAPGGVDAVPYVARAHLGGPRRGEPLAVVDATSSREHDPERWADPLTSPLALADRGLLLLVDGAALPADVQRLVARALEERRAPWERAEPLDVALAMTANVPLAELESTARLDPSLAARFAGAAVAELPRLRDRPEDLRAIVSDRLAREGLRVRGVPMGLDDAAFARLLEHPFEAEDAELTALVQRLVASCDGGVIRAAHVDALFARERLVIAG